jgi:hypothetical protein
MSCVDLAVIIEQIISMWHDPLNRDLQAVKF